MRLLLTLSLLLFVSASQAQAGKKLHFKSTLVDTHNDVLSSLVITGKDISHRLTEGQSDLDRWKEGGLNVQFFSVWTDKTPRNPEGFYKDANQEIDSLEILVLRNVDRMSIALRYRDVRRGVRQGKLVSLIGVEGGHMIEDDMQKLESLYRRGMRYMTLTWNNSTSWASSAMDETSAAFPDSKKGLTEKGKEIVRRMNQLGVIVDLSHTGERTFYDALATTTKPVLLSHSSVWNICPVFRNVKDDQIKAVAKNGGVICINFYSGFISKIFDQRVEWLNSKGKKIFEDSVRANYPDTVALAKAWQKYFDAETEKVRPTLSDMVDHIDYIVKLVGVDYVGIGSDFDGVSSLPIGLEDVTTYPRITDELLKRGYSHRAIKKILGENVLRVMKANFR